MSDGQIIKAYERPGEKNFQTLKGLALDLRWSWNHGADKLWQQLEPTLWDLTHNPWVVLQAASEEKINALFTDATFKKLVDDLVESRKKEMESNTWFKDHHSQSPLTHVAYFSMEFMLSEALPIYSGGLGNVAGDQLKAASDLGVPVVAIGLLYQQGYFRQTIDKDGGQLALYPYNDPLQLPVMPLRLPNGEWLRIEIAFPGWSLWLRTWQVKVGRNYLYLLDSNDSANLPFLRGITSELYGGNSELRLKQEIILGIGGWRLLQAMGIKPEVCHLNEGHAAFAILERAKSYMKEAKVDFNTALSTTRSGNLFTTHTAVPAGFDRFSPALIEQYLEKYAKDDLGIPLRDLLALGRQNPDNPSEEFNMAYLAIRGSGAVNGVSQLHGKVSRHLFESLFLRWPKDEVPVGYVTNGVHMPSWDSAEADEMWTKKCTKERWLGRCCEELENGMKCISDEDIWKMRNGSRKKLVEYSRDRLSKQLQARGWPDELVERAKHIFDPNALTLGFARRFATYKRPNMLLSDPERLLRIVNNASCPVQLIIAGKAHPADSQGQALIKEWILFIRKNLVRPHIIFLSDYDMLLTEQLVQGVDVWINTPRRPWEACGTSGMKVLVNGGLNLSELDGWWVEAYTPEVGWALGDGKEHGDDPAWDAKEASALYDILEKEVIPTFYKRNDKGLPDAWLAKVRASMSKLTPRFSASRAVIDYTEKHYIPAADNYRKRTANNGALGNQIEQSKKLLQEKWQAIRFGQAKSETKGDKHFFEIEVILSDLNPKLVKVELYSEGDPLIKQEMTTSSTKGPTYLYSASVPSSRPSNNYTARVIPSIAQVSIPLEINNIIWQH